MNDFFAESEGWRDMFVAPRPRVPKELVSNTAWLNNTKRGKHAALNILSDMFLRENGGAPLPGADLPETIQVTDPVLAQAIRKAEAGGTAGT